MVLRRNAPIEVDLDTLTIEPDVEAARKLFDFLEFRALTDRLFEAIGTPGTEQPSAEMQVLELSRPEVREGEVTARVLLVDRFGNASLDVAHADLAGSGLSLGKDVAPTAAFG